MQLFAAYEQILFLFLFAVGKKCGGFYSFLNKIETAIYTFTRYIFALKKCFYLKNVFAFFMFIEFLRFFTFLSSFPNVCFTACVLYILAASLMFVLQLVYFQNNNNSWNWFHSLFSTKTKTITKLIIIDWRREKKWKLWFLAKHFVTQISRGKSKEKSMTPLRHTYRTRATTSRTQIVKVTVWMLNQMQYRWQH